MADDARMISPILTLNLFLMGEFRRSLRKHAKLNVAEYRILSLLDSSREPLRACDIERSLSVNQAVVSSELGKLQSDGYVCRSISSVGTSGNLTLTPAGRQVLRKGDEAVIAAYRDVYGPLDAELGNVNLQGGILGAFPTGRIRIRNDEYFGEHAFFEVSLKSETLATKSTQENGLSLNEFRVLLELYTHGRAMSPGELSDMLLLDPPRIAEACGRLELRGLITRRAARLDRRRRETLLTAEGAELIGRVSRKVIDACFSATHRDLNDKEISLTLEIAEICTARARINRAGGGADSPLG